MNLATTYLGFPLPHPIMPGASPLVDNLDTVRRLEDAGAAAIVLHSLFEEQIVQEQLGAIRHLHGHGESFAEAATYFPDSDVFALGPDRYLEQVRRIREAVGVPVIASLNGVTPGGWLEYARLIEEAGASALELNLYFVATDAEESSSQVEWRHCDIVRTVTSAVRIPVAVKVNTFYTSLPHFARSLEANGARGIILFNRFYQPDIDIERLEVSRQLQLSSSYSLLVRLQWLGILASKTGLSLGCSGGVHTPVDVMKAVMAGAHAVQVVSALLKRGPAYLTELVAGVAAWLEAHEYESLAQAQGSMSLARCPDPHAYERGNYIRLLQSWRVDGVTA